MKLIYENKFRKDFKKAEKQKKDIDILNNVISCLLEGKTLDSKYKDHKLKGKYKNYKECHLANDWLLIYKIERLSLFLSRMGSHSELFS